ncbi:septal ring lytic transglycosylase RlpA family protein [Algimonas porphyrae]|nr:septal ring lytic transglycosylase RlpA family protein [Algimonas porphyrae]
MRTTFLKMTMIAAASGLLATGCATSQVTATSKAAPITYKIGQGGTQFASLSTPERSSRRALPRYNAPLGAQGRIFDPSKIDRQLYSHQKVGKRYTIMGRSYKPQHDPDYDQTGTASWYGPKFHGKPTANGETFDKRAMTAAHKTLPLNSMVVVTNLENGRTVTLRLNDRGPFIGNRIIDLSEAAAEALGYKANGLAEVRVQYAGPADPMAGDRILPRRSPRVAELPRDNITIPTSPRTNPCHDVSTRMGDGTVIPAACETVPRTRRKFAAPSLPTPIAPSQPRRAQPITPPASGNITMTIKGPIHIAKSDETQPKPEFIAEPVRTK